MAGHRLGAPHFPLHPWRGGHPRPGPMHHRLTADGPGRNGPPRAAQWWVPRPQHVIVDPRSRRALPPPRPPAPPLLRVSGLVPVPTAHRRPQLEPNALELEHNPVLEIEVCGPGAEGGVAAAEDGPGPPPPQLGGGYWRLEMQLGRVLGHGNAVGVGSGPESWDGGGTPTPFKRCPACRTRGFGYVCAWGGRGGSGCPLRCSWACTAERRPLASNMLCLV